MHHMRVLLDDHFVSKLHASRRRNTPHVIATEINQHQVLGPLFLVIKQRRS